MAGYEADRGRYMNEARPGGGKGYSRGGSFTTDFSQVGTGASSSRIFGTGGGMTSGVLEDEERAINKVFQIVDKDNSGQIDMAELQDMFKLFKADSTLLTNTIQRIMQKVDANFDGMISQKEFYELLSQKFRKGDSRKDIDTVFRKMSENGTTLGVEEMRKVAEKLGEDVTKEEIKEMIKMFNRDYQNKLKEVAKKPKDQQVLPEPPTTISVEDFYEAMQEEIPASTRDTMM